MDRDKADSAGPYDGLSREELVNTLQRVLPPNKSEARKGPDLGAFGYPKKDAPTDLDERTESDVNLLVNLDVLSSENWRPHPGASDVADNRKKAILQKASDELADQQGRTRVPLQIKDTPTGVYHSQGDVQQLRINREDTKDLETAVGSMAKVNFEAFQRHVVKHPKQHEEVSDLKRIEWQDAFRASDSGESLNDENHAAKADAKNYSDEVRAAFKQALEVRLEQRKEDENKQR